MMGVVEKLDVNGFGADAIPVEHAQPILTLAPIEGSNTVAGAGAGKASGSASGTTRKGTGSEAKDSASVPEGCHAVVCPADGIFYRRPRPGGNRNRLHRGDS